MCLIISSKETLPKVAKEDIIIYKLLEERETNDTCKLLSPFQEWEYAKNVRNPEVKLKVVSCADTNASCSGDRAKLFLQNKYGGKWYFNKTLGAVTRGYHAYSDLETALHDKENLIICEWENLVLFKGIIPKGAEYVESEYGEIVGSTIIILKRIN